MKVLVTGGAGYIGSHIVKKLLNQGHEVVVFDNLEKGHKAAVDKRADFVFGDLSNKVKVSMMFKHEIFDAVVHMAAHSLVGESVEQPGKYFANNVVNSLNLLDHMVKNNCLKIVFSSSAAVYGNPVETPITENSPTRPTNPYGESKLMFERIMEWYKKAYGLQYTSLRYFNAAGADESLGEHHEPETHLIPIVMKAALGQIPEVKVFGTDYETPDGTCVRDYVHVSDLADAHVLALQRSGIYNLGSEKGCSVRKIIEAVKKITGVEIKTQDSAKRPGDPPVLVASSGKIRKELGWEPKYDLRYILTSAWNWHKANPFGYKR